MSHLRPGFLAGWKQAPHERRVNRWALRRAEGHHLEAQQQEESGAPHHQSQRTARWTNLEGLVVVSNFGCRGQGEAFRIKGDCAGAEAF
jgi:hypothetical protein